MDSTNEKEKQAVSACDGGTGIHRHADCKEAYRSVSAADKRRAFIMLGAAGVTICFGLLTRLVWLFEPLLDKIYYGTLSEVVYYIILGLLCTAYIISLNVFTKKYAGIRLFHPRKSGINIARALGVIAVGAVAVFIVSAVFGFQLKMQKEMGMGVTMATALTNISVYFYYAFHIWLGFAAAALVQYAMSMLFPAKYTVPWGAVFLVTVYGLLEFVFEYATTSHLYSIYYYIFVYAYAAVFVLSGRSFHVSYWASVIIMVL